MKYLIRLCCLILTMSFTFGCTINQFQQSFPQSVYGDGWSISKKWSFLDGEIVTVTGHGLEFDIYAHNEDKVSELWIPTEGWHQLHPFILSVYILHVKDGLSVNWNSMKIISNGREYVVKELFGPYNISESQCNPKRTTFTRNYNSEFFTRYTISNISANSCIFLEFNAINSNIGYFFDSELNEMRNNKVILPNLRILWEP